MHNNKGCESLLNPGYHCFDINLTANKKWRVTVFNIRNRLPIKQLTMHCRGRVTNGAEELLLSQFYGSEEHFTVIARYLFIDSILQFQCIIKGWGV